MILVVALALYAVPPAAAATSQSCNDEKKRAGSAIVKRFMVKGDGGGKCDCDKKDELREALEYVADGLRVDAVAFAQFSILMLVTL